jgi:hypothetical protein
MNLICIVGYVGWWYNFKTTGKERGKTWNTMNYIIAIPAFSRGNETRGKEKENLSTVQVVEIKMFQKY